MVEMILGGGNFNLSLAHQCGCECAKGCEENRPGSPSYLVGYADGYFDVKHDVPPPAA